MKTIIVAEIGSNWEGSLTKAKKIITESKKMGADAVKFQMWRASDLYKITHPNWIQIKNSELTFSKAKQIKTFCDKKKIDFFCSAFYPEAVTFLNSLRVKKFKIASRTCLMKDPFSIETLNEKANSRKEIIISMGMGGNQNKIKNIFKKNKTLFCYCISEYPLKIEKIDWKIAQKYDGFSDHTMDIMAPIIFTLLKRKKNSKQIYIEKHVKLNNSKGPDASTSIDIDEFGKMISAIRTIEKLKI